MTRRRVLTFVSLGAALGILLVVAGRAARVFQLEVRSLAPHPTVIDAAPARRVLPGLEEVSWTAPSGKLSGWFARGASAGAVVLVHGSGGNREQMLEEMRLLHERELSVLAFDLPGHGASEGEGRYGEPMDRAVSSAVDFLKRDASHEAITGIFGFSLGGHVALQAASRDARLRAVAVAGTPADLGRQAEHEYASYGSWFVGPAFFAMRLRGLDPAERAEDAAEHLSRPLFVVAGGRDAVVPRELVEPIYARASSPKRWLFLPRAEHGHYVESSGDEYARALGDFFVAALNDDRAESPAPRHAETPTVSDGRAL